MLDLRDFAVRDDTCRGKLKHVDDAVISISEHCILILSMKMK